jgi:hypothetical protein
LVGWFPIATLFGGVGGFTGGPSRVKGAFGVGFADQGREVKPRAGSSSADLPAV